MPLFFFFFSLLLLGFAAAVLLLYVFLLGPMATCRRLQKEGFTGPPPGFPFGNLHHIKNSFKNSPPPGTITHDVHAAAFPYFARWRKTYGDVFVYWLGVEPFVYVADPEFLRRATAGPLGKLYGKPDVFRRDRRPMFGSSLVMADGDDWAHRRRIIAPAFSPANLNAMIGVMEECTLKLLRQWEQQLLSSGSSTVDVEEGVVANASEIIAKTSFGIGIGDEVDGMEIFAKLRKMQSLLFSNTGRLVGVPFAGVLNWKHSSAARKLGEEIDALLLAVIEKRRREGCAGKSDLLSLLLADCDDTPAPEKESSRRLTARELVDECKTFFFGGHETTALLIAWTLLLLANHPDWQFALREEVDDAFAGADKLDAGVIAKLTKMNWVMSEVLRLLPPSPNAQRQAREDIALDGGGVIPKGTNMWIDIVAMHREKALWGETALEFRPERFAGDPAAGGCRHKMGYVPFGVGARVCIGRNLTATEFKTVMCLVLRRFALEVSPEYRHAPRAVLSFRPAAGIQLRLRLLQ